MLRSSRAIIASTYQLWTVARNGSRSGGDPDYAKRFAESCTLGGGEGFEVFAPLTNKVYGKPPGAWQVIKSPEHRVGKWEQERYWPSTWPSADSVTTRTRSRFLAPRIPPPLRRRG